MAAPIPDTARDFDTSAITPEAVDYYILEARRLRAECLRDMALGLFGFLSHGFVRSKTNIRETASGLTLPAAGTVIPTRHAISD